MSTNFRVLNRKLHRLGALLTALPFLVVLVTGLLLQVKKQVTWVQPAEQRGVGTVPVVSLDAMLAAARSVPEAGIATWEDVDRVDVRPSKGVAKVVGNSRWEIQVDLATGEMLQAAYRRSDLIESMHDGSWFHDAAKLWIFLPSGVVVFGLWVTGIYLWFLPRLARRARERRQPPAAVPPSRAEERELTGLPR